MTLLSPLRIGRAGSSVLALAITIGCYSAKGVSPAPIPFRWPEPAFEPARQCHGGFRETDLTRYLARASLARWLPGTATVAVDQSRRCIRILVDDVGTGRLVELLLRGSVPRRAVLLELSEPLYRASS